MVRCSNLSTQPTQVLHSLRHTNWKVIDSNSKPYQVPNLTKFATIPSSKNMKKVEMKIEIEY